MSSRIHKLEISFDPFQDRLILKFHTEDLSEYRLWLTRRFTKLLWKILQDLLKKMTSSPKQQAQEVKKISHAFEKEQSMKNSTFAQKYSSKVNISKTPLGIEPILITKIQITEQETNGPILCLLPEKGQGFEILASSMIINALCKLISETLSKTDWDLPFTY